LFIVIAIGGMYRPGGGLARPEELHVLDRFISKLRKLPKEPSHTKKIRQPVVMEEMEDRTHLSTTLRVVAISGDNRGEVDLTMNEAVNPATVNASSCILYLPGPDGKIGTADDVRYHVAVTWDASTLRITLHGRINLITTPDLGYRIRIISTKLLAANGSELDGEYNGAGVETGNGHAGGDLDCEFTAPTGNPTVRISTSLGTINVLLLESEVKATVRNFLRYANDALYDYSIIHNSVTDFAIQGGGYNINLDNNGLPTAIAQFAPIATQSGIANTEGTIAMAQTDEANSATDQWFFNTVNNSSKLDATKTSAGYAVFGAITNSSGLAVMQAIAAAATVNLTPSTPNTAFEAVPETDGAFITVRRIAVIEKVSAL
jgi:peptidyl-prolyl cis-trans isomerase A (cyclophilin A)